MPFLALTTATQAAGEAIVHSGAATPQGRFEYSSGPSVSLAIRPDAAEILISDTGRFDLPVDRAELRHLAPADADRQAVALDLIGVVLPYLFHRDGAWCLHASAVRTPTGVIAFVAARGTGKSTLAAACVHAGCALVADDVVVLRLHGDRVHVTPSGVPLRLRASTAQALLADESGASDAWGKVRVEGTLAEGEQPLAAIYMLQPMSGEAPVERQVRPVRAAALALLANGKITELLGGEAAGEVLTRCVALAQASTCYDLAVPRDLARLEAVAGALLAWHATPPERPPA